MPGVADERTAEAIPPKFAVWAGGVFAYRGIGSGGTESGANRGETKTGGGEGDEPRDYLQMDLGGQEAGRDIVEAFAGSAKTQTEAVSEP